MGSKITAISISGLLGIIPQGRAESLKILHVTDAVFAFGGLYLGTWTFCIHMLTKEDFKQKAIVMTMLAFGTSIGLALTQTIRLLTFPESGSVPGRVEIPKCGGRGPHGCLHGALLVGASCA